MSTTTTTTAQRAAEARAEAERLEAEAAAEAKAHAEREDAALRAEATWRHEQHTPSLKAKRDEAEEALRAVQENPDATMAELWDAYSAVRVASALHYQLAATNAGNADFRLGPIRRNTRGLGLLAVDTIPRPRPAQDYWAHVSFSDVLAKTIEIRSGLAVDAAMRDLSAREAQALANADK